MNATQQRNLKKEIGKLAADAVARLDAQLEMVSNGASLFAREVQNHQRTIAMLTAARVADLKDRAELARRLEEAEKGLRLVRVAGWDFHNMTFLQRLWWLWTGDVPLCPTDNTEGDARV